MGSVTNLTTTGDNDPEIFPVQYYNHYMYCDNCGSFQIKIWIEPENYLQLQRIDKWLTRLVIIAVLATLLAAVIALMGLPLLFVISLLVLIGAAVALNRVKERIQYRGVCCENCQTTYKYGSAFFTEAEKNPRGYTMEDVPTPLYLTYQIRGAEVDPAEEE